VGSLGGSVKLVLRKSLQVDLKNKLLTLEEINKCIAETGISVFEGDIYIFARAIEALVMEKHHVDTNQ